MTLNYANNHLHFLKNVLFLQQFRFITSLGKRTIREYSEGGIRFMELSHEVRELCDSFYANTVENNEVYIVKWVFPNGEMPDLSLERALKDRTLADETESAARRMLGNCRLHTDEIMLKVLIYYCGYIRKNSDNYWLRFDLNHYSRIIPTFLEKLLAIPRETNAQRAFYLKVLHNFPPFVAKLREKLEKQAQMYIRMPKEGCRLVIRSLEDCEPMLRALDCIPGAQADAGELVEAVHALIDYISGDYLHQAPTAIGMGQYPGGRELYARQVETYISRNIPPEEIHARGYRALADTEAQMLEIAHNLGYTGTLKEIMDQIQADPRYRFSSPEEMQQTMTAYLDQIRPLMPKYFSRMPKADCAVARLDPSAEGTTSWGYYNIPVENPVGVYYYSAAELDKRCQIRTNAVVYHELLPGHHYQMNLVLEDDTLPDILHHHYNTACADGWAEYASGFCRELGLYAPINDFGRLSWDAFLCCRLIVDTGLNALGWTYEQARDFLKAHTMFTDAEIHTELLRYTFGMPAQALSYKWGSLQFNEMRRRAQTELGAGFDLRAFHDAMLEFGAIPLDILEEHFEWYLKQQKERIGQ